jgi:hypothetical protein
VPHGSPNSYLAGLDFQSTFHEIGDKIAILPLCPDQSSMHNLQSVLVNIQVTMQDEPTLLSDMPNA